MAVVNTIFQMHQRLARDSDIDDLLILEEDSWAPSMRHTRQQILRFLKLNPDSVFVYEADDGRVIGVIYSQRIETMEAVDTIAWAKNAFKQEETNAQPGTGQILQLMRVNTLQRERGGNVMGVGAQLRDLALRYAASLQIKTVCALTRATHFTDSGGSDEYEDYVLKRLSTKGIHDKDAGLNFHLFRGAKVQRIAKGWRPEDTANAGNGILIAYDLQAMGLLTAGSKSKEVETKLTSIVSNILERKINESDVKTPLVELGMDSLSMPALNYAIHDQFDVDLGPVGVYNFPTIHALAEFIAKGEAAGAADTTSQRTTTSTKSKVAIVGMSCRFPGGIEGPEELWEATSAGKSVVGTIPKTRWDVHAVIAMDKTLSDDAKARLHYGGFMEDIDSFDANFFGISASEASKMDPQQRLALEYSYAALYDAGYRTKESLEGLNAGVFVGIFGTDAIEVASSAAGSSNLYSVLGTAHSVAAGRISFALGLTGPCCSYDTACSSSLVALHAAMRSLQHGDCDMAVVVGVNVMLTPTASKAMAVAGATSPTGKCHTFDASGDGYCRSEGCGAVVLKRIEDVDKGGVYAVLRGAAVAQDGTSASLMAPNGRAQEKLLRSTLEDAGLEGHEVDYMEAHGTGTSLGDPIEVGAISAVLGKPEKRQSPLMMGSVKANIGHLEGAAGMAGLIHAILVLQHETVVPNAELKTLNLKISQAMGSAWLEFPSTAKPLRVKNDGATGSESEKLLVAGLSSFGFSGTIAHALLEQAPREMTRSVGGSPKIPVMETPILFLFTGQGSQYPDMGLELYEKEPVFRAVLDECDELFQEFYSGEKSLLAMVLPGRVDAGAVGPAGGSSSFLSETQYTQPALFALECAMARLWESRGVVPSMVLGHSVGEIAAACVARCMSLQDGMKLVLERGRLMQALPVMNGVMVAARLAADDVFRCIQELGLEDTMSISGVNGPKSLVLAGTEESVKTVLEKFGTRGKQLDVSHAFHSPLMKGMKEDFAAVIRRVCPHLEPPRIPLMSTVTGRLAMAAELTSVDHWVEQLTCPVLFSDAIEGAFASDDEGRGVRSVLEVGPHPVLSGMARPFLKSRYPDVTWHASLDRTKEASAIGGMGRLIDEVYKHRRSFPPLVPVPHPLIQKQASSCGGGHGFLISEVVLHDDIVLLYSRIGTNVQNCPGLLFLEWSLALTLREHRPSLSSMATVEIRGVVLSGSIPLRSGVGISCHSQRLSPSSCSFEFFPFTSSREWAGRVSESWIVDGQQLSKSSLVSSRSLQSLEARKLECSTPHQKRTSSSGVSYGLVQSWKTEENNGDSSCFLALLQCSGGDVDMNTASMFYLDPALFGSAVRAVDILASEGECWMWESANSVTIHYLSFASSGQHQPLWIGFEVGSESSDESLVVRSLAIYDNHGNILLEATGCVFVPDEEGVEDHSPSSQARNREGAVSATSPESSFGAVAGNEKFSADVDVDSRREERYVLSKADWQRLVAAARDAIDELQDVTDEATILETNLFDAGLDSLASVELLEQFNQALPEGFPPLNMSILFHHQSIRGMIDALVSQQEDCEEKKEEFEDTVSRPAVATKDFSGEVGGTKKASKTVVSATPSSASKTVMSPMIQLQAGNTSQVEAGGRLFLLPGACFSSRCFLQLCSTLGSDIPVYGFEDLTLYNLRSPWSSIAEIASEFISFMKEKQPKGPYKIGGWSMGGIIAYEAMRQLLKNGDRVDSLFLMDASIPAYQGIPVESDLDTASSIFVAHSLGYTVPRVSFLEDENAFIKWTQAERVEYILARAQQLGVIKNCVSAKGQVLYSIEQFKNLIMLAQQYDFPGLRTAEFAKEEYPRVVSMRASRNIEDNMIFRDVFSNGLRVVTGQSDENDEYFEMHEVPTHHWGLPAHKNVATIMATHLGTYYDWPVRVDDTQQGSKKKRAGSSQLLGLEGLSNWKLTASSDVVFIGAGTIGMMCAIFLKTMFAPKANVVMLEQSTMWEHVIGEGMLAASSKGLSHALGRETMRILMGIKDGLAFWRIDESCKRLDDGLAAFASGVEETFQVERHTLNLALAERCRRLGIKIMRGTRVDISESDIESPRKRVRAKTSDGGKIDVEGRLVVDSSGYASLISRHYGVYQTNYADFDFNAYYGYYRLKSMPDIFNFAASMGRNVVFPEGFMWMFLIVSWAENTEEEMQDLVERLADIQENDGVFPSRARAAGEFNLKWAPVFSIGITVRKDLDFSSGKPQERFHQFVDKYPAMQHILSHFEYMPDLYKDVGTKKHTGFGQFSSIGKRSKQVAGDGWLVIGDAAGHVNPFLGLGVNYGCGEAFHAAHDLSCALAVDCPATRYMFKGFESYSDSIYKALSLEMEVFYRTFQCSEIFERVLAYKFGWLVYDLLSRNDYDYVAGDAQTFELLNPAYQGALKEVLRLVRAQKSSQEISDGKLTVDALSNQGLDRDPTFSPALIKEVTDKVTAKIADNMQLLHLAQLRLSRFLDYYDDDLRRTDKARKGDSAESASDFSMATSGQRFTLRRCVKDTCKAVNGASNKHCSTCGAELPAVDMKLHDWTHGYKIPDTPDFLSHGRSLVDSFSASMGNRDSGGVKLRISAQNPKRMSQPSQGSSRKRSSIRSSGLRRRSSIRSSGLYTGLSKHQFSGLLSLDDMSSRSEILILVGTQTNTSSSYAAQIEKLFSGEDSRICVITSMNEYDPGQLLYEHRKVIFVTSTYGSGDPPETAVHFHRWLSIALEEKSNLDSLYFAVLALGDSSYDYFCGFGIFVDQTLALLGGHRIVERAMLDASSEPQGSFVQWSKKLRPSFLVPKSQLIEAGEPELSRNSLSLSEAPRWAVVNRSALVTGYIEGFGVVETAVVHLDLELEDEPGNFSESQWTFAPGDHVGIRPWNSLSAVTLVASFFEAPLKREVSVALPSATIRTSVQECLRKFVDLSAVPRRTFWSALQINIVAGDRAMDTRLQKIIDLRELLDAFEPEEADEAPRARRGQLMRDAVHMRTLVKHTATRTISLIDEGLDDDEEDVISDVAGSPLPGDIEYLDRIEEVDEGTLKAILNRPKSEVYKVLTRPLWDAIQSPLLEGLPLTLDRFIEVAPLITERFYSVTAPLGLESRIKPNVSICVSELSTFERGTGHVRPGHCSTLLTKLAVGDGLSLSWKPNPHFKLRADEKVPVIMVATGTGIAPFRGFMAERATSMTKRKRQSWYLFFGCQSEKQYLYKEEVSAWKTSGLVDDVFVAFSREQGHEKRYVQDDLREQGKLVHSLLMKKKGIVMVCGRTAMVAAVRQVLQDVIETNGGMPEEEAADAVQSLQTSGHIILDNWA